MKRPITTRLLAALAVFAFALLTAAAPPPPGVISVHYIDVGQGDAILIQSSTNAVLIDGGDAKTAQRVTAYLRAAQVKTLDYIIATHPHADHIGGLPAVIQQFGVKDIIMPDAPHTTATFDKLLSAIERKKLEITVPKVGDKFSAGIIEFTVLSPGRKYKDLNDMSVVVRMVHGEMSFLFTGDAEAHAEQAMIKSGRPLRSDVLKAGHHGSRTSSTPAFLAAVRPSIVVIMCGTGNKYGHPHAEMLANIKRQGNVTIYRTDQNGNIVLSSDGKKITPKTGRK